MGWVNANDVFRDHRAQETEALGWHARGDTSGAASKVHEIALETVQGKGWMGFNWRPRCSCGWTPDRRVFRERIGAERSGQRHIAREKELAA